MKVIQKTIWLLFIALACTACSKSSDPFDEDCDPDDEESPCYLAVGVGDKLLLTELKSNGKMNSRFEYDSQNRMTVMYSYGDDGTFTTVKYFYNGNNLAKVEYSSAGNIVLIEEFAYGSGDKPTSGTLKEQNGKLISTSSFTYAGNNVTETIVDKVTELIVTHIYRFDDKGNCTSQTYSFNGDVAWTETRGDYDDKPNAITSNVVFWRGASINNYRSFLRVTQIPGGGEMIVNQIWKYDYNAAGYPMKAEVYDRQSNTLVETHTYTYIKAK